MTKERPILLNDEMVRAILDGRKTQTRRVAKNVHLDSRYRAKWKAVRKHTEVSIDTPAAMLGEVCPYGQPGDRLWVREAWQGPLVPWNRAPELFEDSRPFECPEYCEYRADGGTAPVFMNADDEERQGWRPSIHMPRWASRITLEITDVRVERLQDISEEDAKAEGVMGEKEAAAADLQWYDKPRRAFRFLWQSINGPDSWGANPWVWVIEFKRIDQEAKAA